MEQHENIVIRSIGILTSGGDAPGMNAVIRGVVRAGSAKGLKVYGVKNGYSGLINGEFELLGKRDVSNILHRGGNFAAMQNFSSPMPIIRKGEESGEKAIST